MTPASRADRLEGLLRAAVPEYVGMTPISYDGGEYLKLRFAPVAGTSKYRHSYVSCVAVEKAETTFDFIQMASEALACAYANDRTVATRHIQDLLRARGYQSIAEVRDDGVRVWFVGKKTGRSFYVSVDDAEATRIADGVTNASDLVARGIEMLETEPGRKM